MTRARTTKSIVRARMAKTGERYTTARRHVLEATAAAPDGPLQPARRPSVVRTTPVPAPRASDPRVPTAPAAGVRGAVSEARVIERTGHDLAYWFGVLDAFGAGTKGHTAAARFLRADHGVDGWYSQAITVLHERARGVRTVNQRVTGGFAFGASKIVPATVSEVQAAFENLRARRVWTRGLDAGLVGALDAGVDPRHTPAFVPRSRRQASCRFMWGTSRVEIRLTPRPDGRTTINVDHSKLDSRADVEARRPSWKTALSAVAVWIARASGAGHRR